MFFRKNIKKIWLLNKNTAYLRKNCCLNKIAASTVNDC